MLYIFKTAGIRGRTYHKHKTFKFSEYLIKTYTNNGDLVLDSIEVTIVLL